VAVYDAAVIRSDGTLDLAPRIAVLALVLAGLGIAIVDPFTLLLYVVYLPVALVLTFRKPRNPVSWLVLLVAFGFLGTTTFPELDIEGLQRGSAALPDALGAWTSAWAGTATFACMFALVVVFPSGRLPSGRWRGPTVVALATIVVLLVLTALKPTLSVGIEADGVEVQNPFAVLPDAPLWSIAPVDVVSFVVVLGLLGAGVVSMFVRYRRAEGVERLQLRWLLAAVTATVIAVVFGLTTTTLFPEAMGDLGWLPALLAYAAIPVSIGVAVLRYRLYEIDRIVNRAVLYGSLTAILAGVFAAATAISQRVFIAMTGEGSEVIVILTTLGVATIYAPVRERVEAAVDRTFKYDQRVFGAYLDEVNSLLALTNPSRAAQRLAREVASETGATGAAVLGRDGSPMGTTAGWNGLPDVEVDVDGSGPIGAVLIGPRRDGRPHDVARLELVRQAAGLAASAVIPGMPPPPTRAEGSDVVHEPALAAEDASRAAEAVRHGSGAPRPTDA
jgi:hypothetical protein